MLVQAQLVLLCIFYLVCATRRSLYVFSICYDTEIMVRNIKIIYALVRALDFEVEGQREKGRAKRAWKKSVEEKSMKFDLSMDGAMLPIKVVYCR